MQNEMDRGRGTVSQSPAVAVDAAQYGTARASGNAIAWQVQTHIGKRTAKGIWHPTWYVAQLPGDGGKDWGWSGNRDQAIALPPYWQRRFRAYCETCGMGREFGFIAAADKRVVLDALITDTVVDLLKRGCSVFPGDTLQVEQDGAVLGVEQRHITAASRNLAASLSDKEVK